MNSNNGNPFSPGADSQIVNTSRRIWQEMQQGTPYEITTDCDSDFTADFYNGPADFYKLMPYFINNTENFIFNYADYIVSPPISFNQPAFPSPDALLLPSPGPPTVFRYVNSESKMVTAQLSALFNKRVCYIDRLNFAYNIKYDTGKSEFTCAIKFCYEGTQNFRKAITVTDQQNDFAIDPKYVAVIITTNNVADFLSIAALLDRPGQIGYLKKELARVYADKLNKAKSTAELKKLYENIPPEIIGNIKDFMSFNSLYKHILALSTEDDTGILSWFTDSSSAMINLFATMGNMQELYIRLVAEPGLVKRIFDNLDGQSLTAEGLLSNKIIFSNLLRALCVYNGFEGVTKHGKVFIYGTGHKINANTVTEDETEKRDHSWYLEQIAVTPVKDNGIGMSSPTTMAPTPPSAQNSNKTVHSGHYSPLDMVYLATPGSDVPMAVPAICVKALAHESEKQDIMRNIRIGANIFAIVLGIATLGAASPLLVALAVADIAFATADLTVQAFEKELMKTEGGKEFLQLWDKIMIAGGIATAGPLLVKGMLTAGGKLLKNPDLFATVAGYMVRAVEGAENFTTFVKGTVTVVTDYARLGGIAYKMGKLQDYGVLMLKGQLKLGKTGSEGYALLYKGEVIAEGSYGDIYKALDDIFTRSFKSSVSEVLDEIADAITIPFINGWTKEKIVALPRGQRPNPTEYLPKEYIDRYYKKFEQKISYLVPTEALDRWGRNVIGRLDGQFVMLKSDLDSLLRQSKGDRRYIESQLGFTDGWLKNKKMSRIDIKNSKSLQLRIPTGNEEGANNLWLPGGKLPTGYYEAVTNQILKGNYKETVLKF